MRCQRPLAVGPGIAAAPPGPGLGESAQPARPHRPHLWARDTPTGQCILNLQTTFNRTCHEKNEPKIMRLPLSTCKLADDDDDDDGNKG